MRRSRWSRIRRWCPVIAVSDLMKVSYSVVSRDASVMPFFIAAVFYLIMNGVVTRILSMIEKHYAYYR